ncbi:MAG: hypothetical protein K8R35_06930 [Bacteroidales bacterium]|nr:hypothetical protein [Bacteroidales bacterium]
MYYITLYNKSDKLDLRKKKTAIKEVLEYLVFDKNQKDFKSASILTIEKNYLELEVDETDNNWHMRFGKILANNFGMREFCDPCDSSRLFKWSERCSN